MEKPYLAINTLTRITFVRDIYMILDLHAHSIKSDDGRAKVKNYCQWISAKNIPIDGFVLTEHRQFDDESDYSELNIYI